MPSSKPNTPSKSTFYDDASVHNSDHELPIQGSRVGASGLVGEPGLPPSRPISISTAGQTRTRPASGSMRQFPMFGRAPWSEDGSRPGTAGSRTHISNITASTFLRPMSSRQQREQSMRPTSPTKQLPTLPRASEETIRSKRYRHKARRSDASIVTIDQGPPVDRHAPPIPQSSHGYSQGQYASERSMSRYSQGSRALLRPSTGGQTGVPANSKPLNRARSRNSFRVSLGWSTRRSLSRAASKSSHVSKDFGHRRLGSSPAPPLPGMEKRQLSYAGQGKNYEYYNGNAFFLLKGRLLNARQRPINLVTGLLAILPAALFFGFSAPYLSRVVSAAVPVLFAYLFYVCLSSFLHASFSDPGILPRNLHPHPPDASDNDPLALGPNSSDWVMVKSWEQTAPGSATTAMEVPVKYCKSCNIWRPPRAHHCRICDACIETQDHHCVWLNNCVGRRNYRQFFTFISSGALLSMYLFGASLGHILVYMHQNSLSFSGALKADSNVRGAFAMLLYAILVFAYPASLLGYHLFLVARGESTREYLNSHKFQKKDRHRPFNQRSYLRNFLTVLARPRPPTYMEFKAQHVPGDTRLGNQRRKDIASTPKEKNAVEMKQLEANGHPAGFQGPQHGVLANGMPTATN